LFLQGVQGNQVRNLQQSEIGDGVQKINQVKGMLTDSWTPENPTASRPAINGRRDFISFRRSSYFIEDGSYLRVQEVTLGYRVPAKFAGKAKLENARIYVSGRNLGTFTKYSGYNPDVNSAGSDANVVIGTDYYAYPLARTFTLGITAGW